MTGIWNHEICSILRFAMMFGFGISAVGPFGRRLYPPGVNADATNQSPVFPEYGKNGTPSGKGIGVGKSDSGASSYAQPGPVVITLF